MRPLISADNHVFEPVTLWQERLPTAYRDRGPRLEQSGEWFVMKIEGMPDRKLTRVNPQPAAASSGGASDESVGEKQKRRAVLSKGGGAAPDERLRDMHSDGVIAEVIYPTFGLFIDMVEDSDLQMACAQVYNDWLAETFLHRPEIFVPAAVVPVRDVGAAAAEMERVAALGFRSAMIPTSAPVGMPYNRSEYDPLWRIAGDAHMPLALHTGTGALPSQEKGPGGAVINYAKVGLVSADTLCYFAASGVLERFPDLHVVMVESGAGYLAFCCERMDEAFEEHEQWVNPKLANRPSHYIRTQCHVTLGADRAPLLTKEITGIEPLMWASDYPHPEGTYPHSQETVAKIFAGLSDDDMYAVTCGNAAKLYGLDAVTLAGALA